MYRLPLGVLAGVSLLVLAIPSHAQVQGGRGGRGGAARDPGITALVAGLSLDRYKQTIKGLTRFGDRREGTKRNRDAIDWIEAQLKSYGCSNTERLRYQHLGGRGAASGDQAPPPLPEVNQGAGRTIPNPPTRYGPRVPTGVNLDSMKQPDPRIRALNSEQPTPGEREEVYCTKIGTTHPEEMYIVAGHMDGWGYNEAVNDNASGTAIVMELARIFSQPGVQTDRSIRFILWNNEETGLNGSKAYVAQRYALQGIESPVGSGKYPEPRWLGMIQHDMMLWDHGPPDSTGKVSPEQRRDADINIEFSWTSRFANDAQQLAWFFRSANERYAENYPAAVGYRMSNTDSESFKDYVPAISLRENERVPHTRDGWNPTWHQAMDVWTTFSDKDFLLGLTSAQTTLAAVAQLAGAKVTQ